MKNSKWFRAVAVCAHIATFGQVASVAEAQLVGDGTIASDGTVRGTLRGTSHTCASRIERVDGSDTIMCANVRHACVAVWSADVAPVAGRERGLVCANTRLDEQLLPVATEGVEETHRHALVVSHEGLVVLDSGDLTEFGVLFQPLSILGEQYAQVVLGAAYESPWDIVILDWGSPDGRARVVLSDVGNLFTTSANLLGSSVPPVTVTSCAGTWRWNPATRRFVPPPRRRGRPPAECEFSYGGD